MILNLISFETKDDIVQIPLDGLICTYDEGRIRQNVLKY